MYGYKQSKLALREIVNKPLLLEFHSIYLIGKYFTH